MELKKLKWEIPELTALKKEAHGVEICGPGSTNIVDCVGGGLPGNEN